MDSSKGLRSQCRHLKWELSFLSTLTAFNERNSSRKTRTTKLWEDRKGWASFQSRRSFEAHLIMHRNLVVTCWFKIQDSASSLSWCTCKRMHLLNITFAQYFCLWHYGISVLKNLPSQVSDMGFFIFNTTLFILLSIGNWI
jgi:hypothetical protein